MCISWVDAEAPDPGWSEDDPMEQPLVFKSYGLLVRRDKNYVVHASTYDPETCRWSERGKIPTGMVLSVEVIAEVEIPERENGTR